MCQPLMTGYSMVVTRCCSFQVEKLCSVTSVGKMSSILSAIKHACVEIKHSNEQESKYIKFEDVK